MYIEVNQSCRLCENKLQHAFDTVVMNKYKSRVLYCLNCGLLQINNPTWLDEAYNNPTAFADTGLVMRNLSICQQLSPMLFHVFGVEGRYVDLAGGTGLLVRLMRDTGFDFYWHDPYCSNVHARGFEFAVEKGPCNAVCR